MRKTATLLAALSAAALLATTMAHAFTCKPGEGAEEKVEFAVDAKGNPLMPAEYEHATYLRIVSKVCIAGTSSVTFKDVPSLVLKKVQDGHEAARLVLRLQELGMTADNAADFFKFVAAEKAKVTPPEKATAEAPKGKKH
ncbi:MAG: hypothetical protein RIQ56_55 [Candidatus Parcubacteria bacterium]|jgi:hypothetical protein